ncbi:MAG: ThuA domain-containing protein [Candidatus Thorarchaeota archaeon]|nr:ThuA domain-containing protein [Candidatus Thorarchaeota archaeon]
MIFRGVKSRNTQIASLIVLLLISVCIFSINPPNLTLSTSKTKLINSEMLSPHGQSSPSISDSWSYNDYLTGIEEIFDTFNKFNLSKYGGGWQYEVTRDWTDAAFTNGKYIAHDSECIMGLLSAYVLIGDTKYLEYAEDIWNWDLTYFLDNTYGGYYVRLNQDNSVAIDDKGMFEHGWFGLATAQLYNVTGNSTYLNQMNYIYSFVTSNFYDFGDGSYYGALSRNLGVLVSDVDTNWCAPYARFLLSAYLFTGNSTFGDKAIELVDNLMNYAYDSQYGWIVNRVSSDWASFVNTAKGWYDVLQTFIDAYRVFSSPSYLIFAQTCFYDIQQAKSTAGYLREMNRDWTTTVNNELLGEEDPGVAIAYLRIACELENSTILQESYRYKDAIYAGLHDPVYGGIYRRIYSSGSQSTWKQWCGAGRVMEMLAEFATPSKNQTISVLVWGDADPNGQEKAGRTIAENLEEIGLNVTFVSDFSDLENELVDYNYQSLILVAMPWSDVYSNIPSSTENLIESLVSTSELGLVGFHDIIWQNANNPILETIFGGTLSSFRDRDSIYSIVNISHPIVQELPSSFLLDDDQLLRGSWESGVEIVMEADYLHTPVVVTNEYGGGRSVYIATGGGSGYSSAIVNNDTNLVQLYRNAVFWSCNITDNSETPSSNMALYFDGSDEVIIPSDSSLNPTSALTVMAWIHADDWVGNQRILQKGVDDQYRLLDEGNLEFGLAGVSGGDIGTPLPTTGEWHHVAGTYDGSTISLYVDGVERVSNSASGSLQTSSTSLYIGNKPLSSYPGDRFKGIIDEVRIYNRALSNQEINNTMINTSPATSGLVLYLSFDILDGFTCPDYSGYGNNGTNYGAEIVTSFDWNDINPHLEYPTTPQFENLPASISVDTFTAQWNESTLSGFVILYYELQIDTSPSFSSPNEYSVYATTYELTDLIDGIYYLRVRAVDERLLRSEWSSVSTISVDLPEIHYPTIPEFANLVPFVNTSMYTVEWTESEVEGANIDYYELEMDQSSSFSTPSQYVSVSTSHELHDLVNGTYYLRVRAVDDRELRSSWSTTGTFTVGISYIVPIDSILPIPLFHQHPRGVTTSYFSISWSLPQSYNENDFTYEIQISDAADFSDASPIITTQTMQIFTLDREDWYYLRVRSFNATYQSDWSETTRIAVLVSTLSIDNSEYITIIENSIDQFIIWEINSHFYFNYSIEIGHEIHDVGYFREENVTLSVHDFPVGTYYITLTVIDVIGREYQAEVELHIAQNFSEVLSMLGTTSLVGFFLFFIGVLIYKKYPRKNWKDDVRRQVENTGTVSLEFLATSNEVNVPILTDHLASADYALVSIAGIVYSIGKILDEVRNKLFHEDRVEISQFINEYGLQHDQFKSLILKHQNEFILTEHYVYNRTKIIENLKERFQKTNSLDTDLFYQETDIAPSITETLLSKTGLHCFSYNDHTFKCVDYDGLKFIDQAKENGFVFVTQANENSSTYLGELKSFLSLRREDVVYSSSLNLLVSTKWLSNLRTAVYDQGKVEIQDLANKYGISPTIMLSLLQYFLQGTVSSDNQQFYVESRRIERASDAPTTRWVQPSLRTVYHSNPPPAGVQFQAPVINAEESELAKCVQICGCIWLPISLVMIFITPFGSAAVIVTAMLAFLWRSLSGNPKKNLVRGQIIQKPAKLQPDGRYLCPYCLTPKEYVAEEMNDKGSVYCKECHAIIPLKVAFEYPATVSDTSAIEPTSSTYETSASRTEPKSTTKSEIPKQTRRFMLLGCIGVGLIVISYILQYYTYLLIFEIDTIGMSEIVYIASTSLDVVGSLLLACGLFALRERHSSYFFVAAIVLLVVLPLRFLVGPILVDSFGFLYILAIYFLLFLKYLLIALGILKQKSSSEYPSLWNGTWIVLVAWGSINSFLPLLMGGVYSRSSIDIVYIPGIIMNIVGGFALSLIFLSEIRIIDPTPIIRYAEKIMGFVILIAGIGLSLLGLISWVIYIPVFSESWLGEIGGFTAIIVGLVLIRNDRRT